MKCYRLGYERSQAALAAANEELAKYRARPYATLASDLRAAEADLRAANARADGFKSALELASKAGEQTQREIEEALAAARRECDLLKSIVRDGLAATPHNDACRWDYCVCWKNSARAALATGGEGK